MKRSECFNDAPRSWVVILPPLRVGRGPEDSTLCLGYGQLDEEPREKVHRLKNFFEIALGPVSSSPSHKSAKATASRFSKAIPNGRLVGNHRRAQ